MQEKTIIKLSTLVAIVGLLLLFVLSEEVALERIEAIEDISPQEKVRLEGVVTRLTQKEKAVFFDIDGFKRETTPVIAFPKEELYLKEGNIVEVSGLVEKYHGKKEVVASEIVVKGEIK